MSSYGLVFFGVPNLGLKHESLKEITREHLNKQLILDLSVDTESEPTSYLQGLQEKFISCHRKQTPPMKIISFYEEKKTPTVAVRLFIFHSATTKGKVLLTHALIG
jgi:hypothetical protein